MHTNTRLTQIDLIMIKVNYISINRPTLHYDAAPIERMAILNDDVTSDRHDTHSVSAIHLIENHPCRIRCVSFGGYPPPSLDVFIGRSDVTSDFAFQNGASLSGLQGLRVVTFRTERSTSSYLPKAGDDDSLMKCVASVPGLKPVAELVRLDVDCRWMYVCACVCVCVCLCVFMLGWPALF